MSHRIRVLDALYSFETRELEDCIAQRGGNAILFLLRLLRALRGLRPAVVCGEDAWDVLDA